jgi:Protein of unknown function (DUF4232)
VRDFWGFFASFVGNSAPMRRPPRRVTTALVSCALGVGLVGGVASAAAPHAAATHVATKHPRCTYAHLRIHPGKTGAATGHEGFPIHFKNTGKTTCTLHGYPGVAGLNKHGKQVEQAKRTKNGFLGGVKPGHPIPTVVLKPGHVAAALLEGTDNPVGPQKRCREFHAILVTPPNAKKSTEFSETPPDCTRIEIHPVVHQKDGSQTS